MKNRDLGLGLGGQKSSKMMTFSTHENHEQSMYIAANLRLEEGQEPTKIESNKKQKKKKTRRGEKPSNLRGPGGHNDHWLTLV